MAGNAIASLLYQAPASTPAHGKNAIEALALSPGMIAAGNIDLAKRPIVRNADGTISTVRSIGVNLDGEEVLIPTVSDDGAILTPDQAVDVYRRTGRHLGKFTTPAASTDYAIKLHKQQATMYGGK